MMQLRTAVLAAGLMCLAGIATASSPTLREATGRVAPSPAGLWLAGDEAVFEIVQTSAECYECRLHRAPALSMEPGIVFGTLRPTGKAFVYEGVFADKLDNIKGKPTADKHHTYICRFDPAYRHITFEHYNRGITMNLLRTLPYLLRVGTERNHRRPQDVDGAVRLAPEAANSNPVIL